MKHAALDTLKKPATADLKPLRKYFALILLTLFLVDASIWFAFRVTAENAFRHDLQSVSDEIEQGSLLPFAGDENGTEPQESSFDLPDGFVAVRGDSASEETGEFQETQLFGKTYVTYASPAHLLVAKSDEDVDREWADLGLVLLVVFLAQVIVVYGWWRYLRSRIELIFTV